MIAAAFYAHVSADSGISGLTNSIYPHVIPPDAAIPAITYSVSDDRRGPTLNGASSLKVALFNVDCWSTLYSEAHALSDAVESSLAGYAGLMGAVEVDHVRLDRKFDLFENETELYRVSLQFIVAYY